MISPDDYDGSACPNCGSDHLHAGEPTFNDGLCTVAMRCIACTATWNEVYLLSHYDNLVHPNPVPDD